MGETASRRLLILGLDGLNWPLLDRLSAAGVTPHLSRLRGEGAWGPLTSVIPTQSATAWASFMTGQNPARHGVFDFVVRQQDGTYRHARPHPASTLWHHAGSAGLRVGIHNFPVTYPPDPVNGFLVSGMLAPQGRTFTYPPDLGRDILAAVPGYRIDLEWQLYQRREAALLRDLVELTRQHAEAACYLQERYVPDLLAVAFITPDRLQHPLWRHLDPNHPHHNPAEAAALAPALHQFYAVLDCSVGELVRRASTVLIVSDHGFQPAAWQFRVDEWLESRGWLAWQTGRSRTERWLRRLDTPWVRHVRRRLVKDISRHFATFRPGGTIDWARTVAFSPWNEQQGIRLSVWGRDPQGTVRPGAQYDRLRRQIAEALLEAAEPSTGCRAVDRVWMREDLFSGPFFDQMPDLVFSLRPGFSASPSRPGLWTPAGWASGDHSLEGFFLLWGEGVVPGEVAGARLIDVAPTALHLLGVSRPQAMDGQVLTSALVTREPGGEATVAVQALSGQRSSLGEQAPGETALIEPEPYTHALTPEEEVEIQEHLRGLGYL